MTGDTGPTHGTPGAAQRPGAVTLAALAALGALSAAWAGFQWWQLVIARRGGEIFCALGGDACAELWDSGFATAVRAWTGLPVAAWGVVWSVAALALPLAARARVRRGASPEPWWSGTVVVALGGLAAVPVLGGVSLLSGSLCSNCAISYALAVAYAGVCGAALRGAPPRRLSGGAAASAAAVLAAFLVLLYPGTQTPRGAAAAAEALLAASPAPTEGAASDTEQDLFARIGRLPQEHRRFLANARAAYQSGESPPMQPARALHGEAMAPVRITHFSDFMCSHCKSLHEGLEDLVDVVPNGSFSIESRVFPLDGECNPQVAHATRPAVACTAARVSICLESHPRHFEFEGRLFDHQAELSDELVYEIASDYASPRTLRACAASQETARKIEADVEWAMAHDIQGTPLVLVNGRRAEPFLPFLYAMIMTGGDAQHAVFADLPPPAAGVGAGP